jgi:hypothetical protein
LKLKADTVSNIHFAFGVLAMTAIVYGFVRATARDSDLAEIAAFSLAGLVLSLALVHFGFDLGTVVPG